MYIKLIKHSSLLWPSSTGIKYNLALTADPFHYCRQVDTCRGRSCLAELDHSDNTATEGSECESGCVKTLSISATENSVQRGEGGNARRGGGRRVRFLCRQSQLASAHHGRVSVNNMAGGICNMPEVRRKLHVQTKCRMDMVQELQKQFRIT